MDFFQELGKQTTKLMNNFTDTMNEFSSLAARSADSVGNIIMLRGKLEGLKTELNRAYRSLGQALIEDPNGNHAELIAQATKLKSEVEAINSQIEALKSDLKTEGQEAIEDRKQALQDVMQTAGDDLEHGAETFKKTVDSGLNKAEDDFNADVDKDIGKIKTDTDSTK